MSQMTAEIERLQAELDAIGQSGSVAAAPVQKMRTKGTIASSDALDDLANMIADHPEVFVGTKSRFETFRQIAELAKKNGVKTLLGKDWDPRHLYRYQSTLKEKVTKILSSRPDKPRFRVKVQTTKTQMSLPFAA